MIWVVPSNVAGCPLFMNMSNTKNREITAMKNRYSASKFFLSIILLIIVLSLGFIILSPKISSRVIQAKRDVLWDKFYDQNIESGLVDGKRFWEFREFYSPGSFVFKKEGLSGKEITGSIYSDEIAQFNFKKDYFFLHYKSEKIESIEGLTNINSIERLLNKYSFFKKRIINRGSNFVLIDGSNKRYMLLALLKNDELKKANGFFDYTEEDKELVNGKNWLVLAFITLD